MYQEALSAISVKNSVCVRAVMPSDKRPCCCCYRCCYFMLSLGNACWTLGSCLKDLRLSGIHVDLATGTKRRKRRKEAERYVPVKTSLYSLLLSCFLSSVPSGLLLCTARLLHQVVVTEAEVFALAEILHALVFSSFPPIDRVLVCLLLLVEISVDPAVRTRRRGLK